MKNLILLVLTVCLLTTMSTWAQERKSHGPAAKNRKHWINPKPTSIVLFKKHNHKPLTGPRAKNKRLFKDSCQTTALAFRIPLRTIEGNRVKNIRPERANHTVVEAK